MKKIALMSLFLMINFSYGQIQKKKNSSKKTTTSIKVISSKNKVSHAITTPKSDSYAMISPTGDDSLLINQDQNTVYNSSAIELQPDFPGGNKALFSFISKNFQYTDEMIENEIKGKSIASFIIEKDGSISDVKVIRGCGFGTEIEIERVLKLMPKWKSGEQNGLKVRCSYVIPIMIYATKQ